MKGSDLYRQNSSSQPVSQYLTVSAWSSLATHTFHPMTQFSRIVFDISIYGGKVMFGEIQREFVFNYKSLKPEHTFTAQRYSKQIDRSRNRKYIWAIKLTSDFFTKCQTLNFIFVRSMMTDASKSLNQSSFLRWRNVLRPHKVLINSRLPFQKQERSVHALKLMFFSELLWDPKLDFCIFMQ